MLRVFFVLCPLLLRIFFSIAFASFLFPAAAAFSAAFSAASADAAATAAAAKVAK